MLSHFDFSALPSLLAIASLVAVFWSIVRRVEAERLGLWLAGWVLVLCHFFAQFLSGPGGSVARRIQILNVCSLELAGVAFVVSVSSIGATRKGQWLLGLTLGGSSVLYTAAALYEVSGHLIYDTLILLSIAAVATILWRFYRVLTPWTVTVLTTGAVLMALLYRMVERGTPQFGIHCILAELYLMAGLLYWRNFRRLSAGVLTSVVGFTAWATVFPAGLIAGLHAPQIRIEREVWNIPKYFVAVGMILTLLEDHISRFERLAHHDALTGVPNRRLLTDRIEQGLIRARRNNTKLAILVLDLDHFKAINDTYGHSAGDALLKEVVSRLSERLRASDTLARSGGDEFTVVSDVSDAKGAEVLAGALVSALDPPFEVVGRNVYSGISIGVAVYPDDGITSDELRAAADEAMYVAKRSGRHRVASSRNLPDC